MSVSPREPRRFAEPVDGGAGGGADKAAVQLGCYQAEFVVMRAEIGRLIDQQRDLLNFSLAGFGGLIALIGLVTPDQAASVDVATSSPVANVLLLVPWLYCVLALWAADVSRRVWVIANYIVDLTAKAREIADDPGLWAWEEWKVATHDQMPRLKRRSIWALERARWLALVLPQVTAVAAWFMLPHTLDASTWPLVLLAGTATALTVALLTLTGDSAGAPALHSRAGRLGGPVFSAGPDAEHQATGD